MNLTEMSTSIDTLDNFKTYTQGAEQDEEGTGDLPTYNDVAAQSNPNSRFGRWRGWIEKRAAERYADITPEEIERRRARGWSDDQSSQPDEHHDFLVPTTQEPQLLQHHNRSSTPLHLRINADLPSPPSPSQTLDSPIISEPSLEPSLHIPQELLSPTHLSIFHFGSRFLPHSTVPIRCILPLQRDRLLLIGTDSGLSVLNMFPAKWADETSGGTGLIQKGPADAQARVIWQGEAVYQMSILEYEDAGEMTPQGVVLALVGPELDGPPSSGSFQEFPRSLRMYNLASLTSLAKWTISQQVAKPVDLRRSPDWHPQETVKKHRPTSSITKGLRNLMTEGPIRTRPTTLASQGGTKRPPTTKKDSSWDIVDDLPLRWATDFTSLSSSGSRISNTSVISYALWHEGNSRFTRRALLAVATKSNIFLYETPRGERAFHFVKEFYTPVQPRSLTFVQQSVQDAFRSPSDVGPPGTSNGYYHSRIPSDILRTPIVATYGAQTAIFVVFDKKAGIIRIADSAVTDLEMVEGVGNIGSFPSIHGSGAGGSTVGTLGTRRSRVSLDLAAKEHKATWILPSRAEIPIPPIEGSYSDGSVYLLTRGKSTHIVASPLPASIPATPPLYTVTWNYLPSSVTARVHLPASNQSQEGVTEPCLQLIGMGEEGVEVREVPFTYISGSYKGKSKILPEPPVAQNAIGETGFLITGGHWNRYIGAHQLESLNSTMSSSSIESVGTEELVSRVRAEEGVYGWWRKEWEDWRIFWLGDDTTNGSSYIPASPGW